MASHPQTKPVKDSVPKVNDEIAVGSDLEFQRKWWRFTRIIWLVFTAIIIADLLGCFGRGIVAKAHAGTTDGTMEVTYDRIERFSTPSILRVRFGPAAIHDSKVQLWASDSLTKTLGNQRVVPQPEASVIGGGGFLYTFPVTTLPAEVEFALEPMAPGIYQLALKVPNAEPLHLRVYVMP